LGQHMSLMGKTRKLGDREESYITGGDQQRRGVDAKVMVAGLGMENDADGSGGVRKPLCFGFVRGEIIAYAPS